MNFKFSHSKRLYLNMQDVRTNFILPRIVKNLKNNLKKIQLIMFQVQMFFILLLIKDHSMYFWCLFIIYIITIQSDEFFPLNNPFNEIYY